MPETVTATIDAGVATLTLNRPQSLNALDVAMAEALDRETARAAADPAVRCIVITGAGGHFMAGGDIACFHQWLDRPPAERQRDIRRVLEPVHGAIRSIRGAPQPVLASVRGACAGFGLSLMMSCDLALLADTATLSLAYCRIGASPDGGSTYAMPRSIGAKRAMELALLGDRFTAADARAMGLANRVVADAELEAVTAELATRLSRGPRETLARTKQLLQASAARDLDAQLAAEAEAFLAGVAGAEFEEGVRAFIEKRPPRF